MGSYVSSPDLSAFLADFNTRLSALERTRTIGPPEYKTAFPYAAGWADSAAAGFEGATYSKIGRLVVLQGLATKTGGIPAINDLIGTLPVGFRPTGSLTFIVISSSAMLGRVDIGSGGTVRWIDGGTAETDFTSLGGICFMVDL